MSKNIAVIILVLLLLPAFSQSNSLIKPVDSIRNRYLAESDAPQAVAGFKEYWEDAEIHSYVIDLTVLPPFPTAGETFQVWVLLEGFENEFLNDFRVAALNNDGTLAQIIHGPIPVDMSNGYDGVYTCALAVPGTYSIAVQYSLDGGTQWYNFDTDAETANPLPISILECIGNGAYSLNGMNQCLRVPDQPVLDLNSDWTIELWHRPGSIPAADELRAMVAKNNHSLNRQQYLVGWRNDASGVGYTGIYVLISENGAESGARTHLWPYAFQPGNLYYIAVVYRIAQGEVEVFVNGVTQGSVSGYLSSIYASNIDFTIGSASGSNYYHGMIDEVRVSNIARDPSGFVDHYATRSAYAPDANTIGLWHMNGAAGTGEKKDNAQGDDLLDLFEMNSPVAACGFDWDGMSTVGESIKSVSILHYAYPNPFNPQTTISFDLPRQTAVSLRIYDVSGRLVRTLFGGEIIDQGRRDAVWNGRDDTGKQVAAGVYFYRLEAGEFREAKRMVMVK